MAITSISPVRCCQTSCKSSCTDSHQQPNDTITNSITSHVTKLCLLLNCSSTLVMIYLCSYLINFTFSKRQIGKTPILVKKEVSETQDCGCIFNIWIEVFNPNFKFPNLSCNLNSIFEIYFYVKLHPTIQFHFLYTNENQ